MNAITPITPEAAQAAGEVRDRGTDLLYTPGERIFAQAAPMMLAQGWSVWPQERDGRRMPSKVNGKALSWGPYQERHATPEELKLWSKQAGQANVACALGGSSGYTWAVDIDCMDQLVAERIKEIAFHVLGETPFVRVGRAPKMVLVYRYDEGGSPHSRNVRLAGQQDCALEILGAGKAVTLHGLHHVTGRWFTWHGEHTPMTSPPEMAPEVSAIMADRFLEAVAAEFPFEKPATSGSRSSGAVDWATVSTEGVQVPVTKYDDKLADGRESFLRDLAWNTVRRNSALVQAADQEGNLNKVRSSIVAAVIEAFEGRCEVSGDWLGGALALEAEGKVARAVGKLMAGDMKPWAEKAPKAERAKKAVLEQPTDGRPVIKVAGGEMKSTVDAAEQAIIDSELGVYQRGGDLVTIAMSPMTTSDGIVETRRILDLSDYALGEMMGTCAAWGKFDARTGDYVPCDPPHDVVKTLMARKGRWRVPPLAAVITAPTMRSDGSLITTPGYDARTGLLFETTEQWNVPETPTREQALVSMEMLKGVIKDFPFVSDVDRSVVLSGMLTGPIRRSLRAAPLHALSAAERGSGKTKAINVVAIIATGEKASIISMGSKEEETEKRLGSCLLAGDPVIAIDNINGGLGGDFICSVLTEELVKVRILGQSKQPTLPTGVLMTATGNNLEIVGDMTRRTLLGRMDAGMERPELRVFDVDPVEEAFRNRKALVEAALTVLRAFVVAGSPKQANPIGSFEGWSRRVRDALIWLGEADPALAMEQARSSDPKLDATKAMFEQWHQAMGNRKGSVKDIIELAVHKDPIDFVLAKGRENKVLQKLGENAARELAEANVGHRLGGFSNPDLREALFVVAGEAGIISSGKLGKWLSSHAGRVVEGLRLTKESKVNGVQQWRIEDAKAALPV